MLSERQKKEIRDLRSWLECACADVAQYDTEMSADDVFSDADSMSDLIGDRLYDIVENFEGDDWNEGVDLICSMLKHLPTLPNLLKNG